MKISVIIPSTDAIKAARALGSIQLQKGSRADEIIIVGRNLDGLIEDGYDKNIKIVNKHVWINAATARNIGAGLAKYDILLFIDDDCIASIDWIQNNIEALSEPEGIGAVVGRVRGESNRYFARCADLSGFWIQQNEIKKYVKGAYAATFGIKRRLFDSIGGFNPKMDMVEDCDLCERIIKAGYKVAYNPKILIYHDHKKDTLWKLIFFMYRGGIYYRKYSVKGMPDSRLLRRISLIIIWAFQESAQSLLVNKKVYNHRYLYAPGVFIGCLARYVGLTRRPTKQKSLDTLIFFITAECNLSCRHCFYWERLNRHQDISFVDIKRGFESFGEIHNLLLSGGEPFLREDIVRICQFFKEGHNIRYLSIPTNGSMPDIAALRTKEILERLNIPLTIGLSIDGMEQYHDKLRGKTGSFKKAVETYSKIAPLKQRHSKLIITVNPVITAENAQEILKLAEFVKNNMPAVDYFWPCILRGNPKSEGQLVPDGKILREVSAKINQKFYERNKQLAGQIKIWNFVYEAKIKTMQEKKQLIPCQAGRSIGVLDANGDVRACELREPFGNIKEMDFLQIWNSYLAGLMKDSIKNRACYCTHECFIYPSLMKKSKTDPYLFLRLYGFKYIFKIIIKKIFLKAKP